MNLTVHPEMNENAWSEATAIDPRRLTLDSRRIYKGADMIQTVRIGTRGSALALAQTYTVKKLINGVSPGTDIKIKIIKTSGDIHQDIPLGTIGGKGLFIKEIEEALLHDEIDIAVHSMKDVPIDLPDDLIIASIPTREDARDAFICKDTGGWNNLPARSAIGTSSLRRASQVLHLRPHWIIKQLRGNLDTRWRKFEHGDYDAIMLAVAGLKRLKLLSEFVHFLDSQEFIPAIGQGAIGIEIMKNKAALNDLISLINDPVSSQMVFAERAFLKKLGGGCHSCLGAYASIQGDNVTIIGFVGTPDGKTMLRESYTCNLKTPAEETGIALAEKLLILGAKSLLS